MSKQRLVNMWTRNTATVQEVLKGTRSEVGAEERRLSGRAQQVVMLTSAAPFSIDCTLLRIPLTTVSTSYTHESIVWVLFKLQSQTCSDSLTNQHLTRITLVRGKCQRQGTCSIGFNILSRMVITWLNGHISIKISTHNYRCTMLLARIWT